MAETNLIEQWCLSGELVFSPGQSCRETSFQRAFHNFCIRHEREVPDWNPTYYVHPLLSHACTIQLRDVAPHNGVRMVIGADLRVAVMRNAISANIDAQAPSKPSESTSSGGTGSSAPGVGTVSVGVRSYNAIAA